MTSEPSTPAGARGAVDLSSVSGPLADGLPPAPAPTLPEGVLVEVTEENLQGELNRTLSVPALLVVWSSQHPQTRAAVDTAASVAAGLGGRVFVLAADLAARPALTQIFGPLLNQAFGGPSIPATFGVLQGQPVPLFPGVRGDADVRVVVDQLLQAAVQNGMAGRVELGPVDGAEEVPLPPLHQKAFDAIEAGDLATAAAAYEEALAADPKDADAALGLAQVRLLQRTAGVDLAAARAAAAANPTDVDAALTVADLDVLGGHVEDAFGRLVDLVRSTAGEDRDRVRTHLIGLFDVVGNDDERVRRGRTALMTALF